MSRWRWVVVATPNGEPWAECRSKRDAEDWALGYGPLGDGGNLTVERRPRSSPSARRATPEGTPLSRDKGAAGIRARTPEDGA